MPLDDTEVTYQGFTYDDLTRDYSYDPVGGNIISTRSGRPLSTKGGVMNKKAGPRGSIRLQMNILAMILHQGFIVEGQQVVLLDKDKSNLKLTNLVVVDPDDPLEQVYCIATTKGGVVEDTYCGCFVVRGGDTDGLYFTKTFDEAVSVRELFDLTGKLPEHIEYPFWPKWAYRANKKTL